MSANNFQPGFVAGGLLPINAVGGTLAPDVLGARCSTDGNGLWDCTIDDPITDAQALITLGGGGTGPAAGIFLECSTAQVAGKMVVSVRGRRRDTGATITCNAWFKVERVPTNR
jgi:hypothetical protein